MSEKLDGAYILADGSYGLRLELTGSRFLLLWRNSPVLDTRYSFEGGKLIPEDNGLRTAYDNEPYAAITGCRLEDDRIVLEELFPISGPSVTVLARTQYSRYGSVTIENDTVLPMLQGVWKDDRGFLTLRFEGDEVTVNGSDKDHIAAVRYIHASAGEGYSIVNKDPSRDYIVHFLPFEFDGEVITAGIPVCDGPTMRFTLRKK